MVQKITALANISPARLLPFTEHPAAMPSACQMPQQWKQKSFRIPCQVLLLCVSKTQIFQFFRIEIYLEDYRISQSQKQVKSM